MHAFLTVKKNVNVCIKCWNESGPKDTCNLHFIGFSKITD